MIYKQYDPEKVLMNFAGILITGIADGTFVSAERNEDGWSTSVGAGGDVTRVRSRNRTGTVTFTLQAASPTNDLLSAKAATDELYGLGYGPLMVKNANGTTLVMASIAWIKKLPTVEYAAEATDREWILECADIEIYVGGAII